MPFSPQKFREIVFQWIFSLDLSDALEEETISLIMREHAVSKKIVKEAQARALLIWQRKEQIDALIEKTSQAYDLERIQRAERNALRLGVYELIFDDKVHEKIAIAEAIRLCRKFSTPEASQFANALLDALYHNKLLDHNPLSQTST